MKPAFSHALSGAIVAILRPLVRILLRNGVPYGAFANLSKQVYVDVATDEFGIPGRKQSDSRVSVITGLSRKEVSRVGRLPASDDLGAAQRYNRAARVISGWVRDGKFSGESGNPIDLPFEGKISFGSLARSYSGDAPARAVLDELLRVGAVERTTEGTIRLLERSYVPRNSEVEKIGILGTDVSDLISTIDHNIRRADAPFFQRKVCYDHLPSEALPELKKTAGKRAQALLEQLDRWLSGHDRDLNPEAGGTGRKRAGIGIYYFEDDYSGGSKK